MSMQLVASKALACLCAVLALASCSSRQSDEPAPEPEQAPICFKAEVSRYPLQTEYTDFAVFAYKIDGAGTTQKVMMHADDTPYLVRWHESEWTYGPFVTDDGYEQFTKYWDLSASQYDFIGVCPGADNTGSASLGLNADGKAVISNIRGNAPHGDYNPSLSSPDWMVAKTRRTASPLADTDMQASPNAAFADPAEMIDGVPMTFHHLMALVDIKIYAETPVIILRFTAKAQDPDKFYNQGDYNAIDGTWDLRYDEDDYPEYFGQYNYLDGKTITNDPDEPILLASHVEFPQAFPGGERKIDIDIEAKDGTHYKGTITLNESTGGTSWDGNKHYTYTLKIENGVGSTDVILFGVDMDVWQWEHGNTIEETQTNW